MANDDLEALFQPPSGRTAAVWQHGVAPPDATTSQFVLIGCPDIPPELAAEAGRALGFQPNLAAFSPFPGPRDDLALLAQTYAAAQSKEIFLLPALAEFGLREREAVAELAARMRRGDGSPAVHYDEPRLDHPLVVQALADAAAEALAGPDGMPEYPPGRAGVLVVARGDTDPGARASVYALTRLLWEHLGAADARTAFLRHDKPFVTHVLSGLAAGGQPWLIVPVMLEPCESYEHLRQIVDDHLRAHPVCAGLLRLAKPPAGHPALRALLVQRMAELWRGKRQSTGVSAPSPRRAAAAELSVAGDQATGLAAEVHSAQQLREVLPPALVEAERVFVKVTWHGYAPGAYTDPVALDTLLGALRGKAILIEGHTSSRNLGGADFDWETHAQEQRAWIRAQEQEYLRRTGLADVIRRHGAQYLNVTEAYWDGRCVPAATVGAAAGIQLHHEELLSYVPETMWADRNAPFVSFARFKGPTRLAVSNLFGLIPDALRARWHGPNISHFAQVCCDIAHLYGAIFRCHALVEALNVAVKWDRKGLYRSRWGNYDLIESPHLVTYSPGFAAADVLAARLQGQDVRRSAFYDVVGAELGWPEHADKVELPQEWIERLR